MKKKGACRKGRNFKKRGEGGDVIKKTGTKIGTWENNYGKYKNERKR